MKQQEKVQKKTILTFKSNGTTASITTFQSTAISEMILPGNVNVGNQQLEFGGYDEESNNKVKIVKKQINISQLIPKEIVQNAFVKLRCLQIYGQQIYNVEFIGFLDVPNLNYLFLSKNDITNFKSFSKLTLPKLKLLNIQNNLTSQKFLERVKFGRSMYSLLIQQGNRKQILFQDMNRLAKLEPKIIEVIDLRHKQIIKQKSVRQKLRQRFYKVYNKDNGQVCVQKVDIMDEWDYQTLFDF